MNPRLIAFKGKWIFPFDSWLLKTAVELPLSITSDFIYPQYELIQLQAGYDWKLKSAENAIEKLQRNSESIVVRFSLGHLFLCS